MDQEVCGMEACRAWTGEPVEQVGELQQRPYAASQVVEPCREGVDSGVLDDDGEVVELERAPKGVDVGQEGQPQNKEKPGLQRGEPGLWGTCFSHSQKPKNDFSLRVELSMIFDGVLAFSSDI